MFFAFFNSSLRKIFIFQSGDDVICVVWLYGIGSPADHFNHFALHDDKFID